MVTTNSTLESIPTGTVSIPFSIDAVTRDHQNAVVSGAAIFTIKDPTKLATTFDFSVGDRAEYLSDSSQSIGDRLSEIIASAVFSTVSRCPLSELLENQDKLCDDIGERVAAAKAPESMGLEKTNLAVTSVAASPEIAQALMARKSEELKKEADTAVHERQMAAEGIQDSK